MERLMTKEIKRNRKLFSPKHDLELLFLQQVIDEGLDHPTREYKFCPTRKWRCDFVWHDHWLIVEIEGGIWTGGRHTNPLGFTKDCEKYNEASLMGFTVLRFTGAHVRSGYALETTKRFIDGK